MYGDIRMYEKRLKFSFRNDKSLSYPELTAYAGSFEIKTPSLQLYYLE